jgi:2-C-methyl-D-erythritol 2,4-cyclodiphosphate synthase
MPDFRIGQGFDIHRLVTGRPCIIGGVTIPSEVGCDGHSDADPLLHAIIDAMLGACALGDIGEHFPDTDPRWKGADSGVLLSHVAAMVYDRGWRIVNIDATVIAERPKLSAHKRNIAVRISELLKLDPARVSIKAKTHEKLDAVGRSEAVAVHCVVMVSRGE